MDDRDVLRIEEYIRENLRAPDLMDEDDIFEMFSYSSWAAYEVLYRVIRESMKLPPHVSGKERMSAEDIVESFIDEMDYYSNMATDEQAKNIFSIAKDEGICILMYITA